MRLPIDNDRLVILLYRGDCGVTVTPLQNRQARKAGTSWPIQSSTLCAQRCGQERRRRGVVPPEHQAFRTRVRWKYACIQSMSHNQRQVRIDCGCHAAAPLLGLQVSPVLGCNRPWQARNSAMPDLCSCHTVPSAQCYVESVPKIPLTGP